MSGCRQSSRRDSIRLPTSYDTPIAVLDPAGALKYPRQQVTIELPAAQEALGRRLLVGGNPVGDRHALE